MKRSALTLSLLIILIALVTACSVGKERKQAQAVAERYFELFDRADFRSAPKLYDKSFFAGYGQEALVQVLKNNSMKLGKLSSKKLTAWSTTGSAGQPGFTVTFIYEVKYSKAPAKEIITLARVGEGYLITKHNFHSKALK